MNTDKNIEDVIFENPKNMVLIKDKVLMKYNIYPE